MSFPSLLIATAQAARVRRSSRVPHPLSAAALVALSLPLVVFATAPAARAQAPSYTATEIGVLSGGSSGATAGVNNSGQVVGQSYTSAGHDRPTLYSGGTLQNLGTLSGSANYDALATAINGVGTVVGQSSINSTTIRAFKYTGSSLVSLGTLTGSGNSVAFGVNDSGVIVGWSAASGGNIHAFYYNTSMHDLGTLGGTTSEAFGINSSGVIVGDSYTSSGDDHAFYYDGTMHDIGALSGGTSIAAAINSGGAIVGNSTLTSSFDHAFLYQSGVMTDLGVLNGFDGDSTEGNSMAEGINAAGLIVGNSDDYNDSGNNESAFLYDNGILYNLNSVVTNLPSNFYLVDANAISDNGYIAVTAYDTNTSDTVQFLLTPVAGSAAPEPASLALIGGAMSGVALVRRRQRGKTPSA